MRRSGRRFRFLNRTSHRTLRNSRDSTSSPVDNLIAPIYTIALGTADGQVTVDDQFGLPVTLDVPPDTETLAQIAEITGATAFDAPTAQDLAAVYDNLQSRIGTTQDEQEITAWFAAAALVLVVTGAGLSALWFGRLP